MKHIAKDYTEYSGLSEWKKIIRKTKDWIHLYDNLPALETKNKYYAERMPELVAWSISECFDGEPLSIQTGGIRLMKAIMAKELCKPLHMQARLSLMQCARKMKKHKRTFPAKKVTRPIAVTGILQKIFEKLLLRRIQPVIEEVTDIYNAGFKSAQRTETLLLLMRMEIESNMKRGLPTFILGFDVKGGYNNVNFKLLNDRFDNLILPALANKNPNPYYLTSTKILYNHITGNPSMKIWDECEAFRMSRGI